MSETNRWASLRWWGLAAVATTFIVVQANAIDPTPTHTFSAGTAISASQVNENFEDLYAAVSALEDRIAELETDIFPVGTIAFFAMDQVPAGWAPCDGRLIDVDDNITLFSAIGTVYGGDGRTNFALPDLQGRQLMGAGDGVGLSSYRVGERAGRETVTLNTTNLPAHSHSFALPIENPAQDQSGTFVYGRNNQEDAMLMELHETESTGGSQSFDVMNPYLAVTCGIRIEGEYPSRNAP